MSPLDEVTWPFPMVPLALSLSFLALRRHFFPSTRQDAERSQYKAFSARPEEPHLTHDRHVIAKLSCFFYPLSNQEGADLEKGLIGLLLTSVRIKQDGYRYVLHVM